MKRAKPKEMRPDADATASEAPQASLTVDLEEDTDSQSKHPNEAGKASNLRQDKTAKAPEVFLAEVPVPRGIVRISIVEGPQGLVAHARRWYVRDGTLRGTREGFTMGAPEQARTLAQGLLDAALRMEAQTKRE